jgi:hypothetical protein
MRSKMEETLVIMLGYKSLAGKDTVFGFAKDLGFERIAFADKLKYNCMDLFDLSYDQVFGGSKDIMDERYPNERDPEFIYLTGKEVTDRGLDTSVVNPRTSAFLDLRERSYTYQVRNPDYMPFFTPRRILQLYGQDQRSLYRDIWASYLFTTKIPQLKEQGHHKFLITDFRFANEAVVAKRWADKSESNHLKLVNVHRPGVVARSGANDVSETQLDNFPDWDARIINDGDLDDLKGHTHKVLSKLLYPHFEEKIGE